MSYLKQKELEARYLMNTTARKPVEFVRGEGMRLYDSKGREHLDFLAGVGCVCLGHAHPAVTAAIAAQAKKLLLAGVLFYVEGRGEYAEDLSELLNTHNEGGMPWRSFFTNTGAESNEGAIKLARKYGKLYLHGAGTIVSAKRSFHGRTLATTAATGQEVKQASFTPMPSGFLHVAPGCLDELVHIVEASNKAAQDQGCPELAAAAVMLECVQGEGGVRPLEETYLKEVRALTQDLGLLLIIDEIQTGFFRTGLPFSYMHANIVPDVVTLAKGIANGFPCAVLAATGKAAEVFEPGEHGTTFGGNPLAIAAARATLAELKKPEVGTQVKKTGAYFKDRLLELPHVKEVRGKGLMLAIELDKDCALQLVNQALERGMVINSTSESVVRFLPPLIVSETDIDALITVLKELLEDL